MKYSILILIVTQIPVYCQSSLEVFGNTTSADTVFKILSYPGLYQDDIGIQAKSEPTAGRGIAASIFGGILGINSESENTAVLARSFNAYGLRSVSTSGYGGYFRGNKGSLVLAGSAYDTGSGSDEGVISSDPLFSSSDLWLAANDNIVFMLDKNNDEIDSDLEIKNGNGESIFLGEKDGSIKIANELQNHSLPNKHLIPICYGFIIDDSIVFASNNIRINKPGAIGPVYITIAGHDFNTTDYTVVIKLIEEKPNTFLRWEATDEGELAILAQERIGAIPPYFYHDEDFHFIVFKP